MEAWERDLILLCAFGGDASADFEAFCQQVERTGLSFLDGEIVPIQRWNDRANRFTSQPVATLEGLRRLADDTGLLAGVSTPEIDGFGGDLQVRVYVRRHDWDDWAQGFAHASQYRPVMKSGFIPHVGWREAPVARMTRIAEALALRTAFPSATRNLRILEEIEKEAQEEINSLVPRPEQFKGKRMSRKDLAEDFKRRHSNGSLGAQPLEKVEPPVSPEGRDLEDEAALVKVNALEHLHGVYGALLATGADYGYAGPLLEAELSLRVVAQRITKLAERVERAAFERFVSKSNE